MQIFELDINRIKDRHKSISQYDLNDNFIKEWNSIKEASQFLSIYASAITQVAKGNRKTSGKYKWVYNNVY